MKFNPSQNTLYIAVAIFFIGVAIYIQAFADTPIKWLISLAFIGLGILNISRVIKSNQNKK